MIVTDCCCRTAIGSDATLWSKIITANNNAASPLTVIDNLAGAFQIDNIYNCKIVFCGLNTLCGNSIIFSSGTWDTIREWLGSGGRLWIAAEHSGDLSVKCLQDMTNLNSFLSTLGSTLSYTGGDWNNDGPGQIASPAGAANIASGATFEQNRFGELNAGSGTTVWLGASGTTNNGNGKVHTAVERVGDGFLFLCGDSNTVGEAFWRRLWEYEDDQII